MDNPEILGGGNSNRVIREGATVVRNMGAWSPFVHRLLQYLTANDFTESPVLIESSDTKERLSFLEGDIGHYPLSASMQSDEIVVEAATLLRKFHELTAKFEIHPDSQFFLPHDPSAAYEVICHNDFAPYNCVFKNNHLVGLIDFDTAAPGTRLWDIAYAVYRFAPLVTDAHCVEMGWPTAPNRLARLKLFCDAYGLEDRSTLIETVIARLEAMVTFMRENAFNPDHLPIYLADLAYIREQQASFNKAAL